MDQPRVNLYGFPHKGLRNALSQLSFTAGNTDYSDEQSLNQLKSLTKEVLLLLDLHAHSEEEIVLPALETRVVGSTHENIEEHEQLEKEINLLEQQINSIQVDSPPFLGIAFYETVSNFHSKYIAHMFMEESEINPLIWANFSDEELLGFHGQVMASLTPYQIKTWFKFIVPALNSFERSIIMGGFKENAPVDFYNEVFNDLKQYMTTQDHQRMQAILA